MYSVSAHPSQDQIGQEDWNGLLSRQSLLYLSPGLNCRFEFVRAVDQVLIPERAKRLFWTTNHGTTTAILPSYFETKRAGALSWREMRAIPDAYPGRSGVVFNHGDMVAATTMLGHLFDYKDWDCTVLSAVAETPSESVLLTAAAEHGYKPHVMSETVCPYIPLPESWDTLYKGYSKSFRYNIRNSEKSLRSCGEVRLTGVTKPEQVQSFLQQVLFIERCSWKEEAGTSITKNKRQEVFHSLIASIAADQGTLRGYILSIDGNPVAHIFGILCDGIFYCLKLSFAEAYRKSSPGIAITSLVLQDLIAESVKYWDFVGPVEEYKRRWTNHTYTVRKYAFFRPNLKGQLLRLRGQMRALRSSRPLNKPAGE